MGIFFFTENFVYILFTNDLVDRKIITIFVKLNKEMSKIKELKKKESNNINLIDLYQKIVVNDKTKYVELFETLLKHRLDTSFHKDKMIYNIKNLVPDFNNEGLSTFDILVSSFIIDHVGEDYIKNFTRFVTYNERGLIENNDVTTYKNFEQICKEVNKADLKDLGKSLSKQVVTILNDDEWLIIKPLTYESSKKYGANTKWCTTAANDPQYFYKYFRNGILTYCLNKKTGYKIAVYKALNEKTVTFWNQEDSLIDSFGSELSTEVLSLLRKEYNDCKKSNYALADQDFIEKEMTLNGVVYRGRTDRGNVRVNNQFDGDAGQEQPEEEGGDAVFEAPHGNEERVYFDINQPPIDVDAEAELTSLLERELTEDIRNRYNRTNDEQPLMDEINVELDVRRVEMEERPIRFRHTVQFEDEVQVERLHEGEPLPFLDDGLSDIEGGTSSLFEVDFDDIPGGAMAAFGEDENPPLGERRSAVIWNPMNQAEEFLNMGRHNGEQIRQAVQEVRNERNGIETLDAIINLRNERTR